MVTAITGLAASVLDAKKKAAFSAAGQAMGELFTAGCIGSACVKSDYLTTTMIQSLSKTTFSILLPMFLFTSIMKTFVKFGGMTKTSAAIPVIAIIHSFILYTLSRRILMPLFGMMDDDTTAEGRATIISCSFGNAGVVPLIFSEALFRNHSPEVLTKAYSQVSLYVLGWSPFFWSFGRNVLIGKTKQLVSNKTQVFTKIKSLFPPPVVGVFSGMLISLIPPLRNCLISPSDSERTAPLTILFNSLENLGRAANPLALLVLTSSLALGSQSQTSQSNATIIMKKKKDKKEDVLVNEPVSFIRRFACVSVARFLISPSLMYILLLSMEKLGMIGSNKSDPMTWFILLLQSAMPSAQNSVLMLQVAEMGVEASRLAKFLFSIYATAMIPIVILSTVLLDKYGITA